MGLSVPVCVAARMCPCRGGMCVVQGETPFNAACWRGQIEVVHFLAERKVDLTTADNSGPAPSPVMMMMMMMMLLLMMQMMMRMMMMMM